MKKLPNNFDSGKPFDGVSRQSLTPEINLWRCVIRQAIMDLGTKGHDRETALEWFGGTRDFYTVCDFANYEPSYIQRLINEMVKKKMRLRALPGDGPRYMEQKQRKERYLTNTK